MAEYLNLHNNNNQNEKHKQQPPPHDAGARRAPAGARVSHRAMQQQLTFSKHLNNKHIKSTSTTKSFHAHQQQTKYLAPQQQTKYLAYKQQPK